MATKVKCANCGAKNAQGQHRCRVCTHIIDPGADEGLPKGLAKQAKLDARLAAAAANRPRSTVPDEWPGAPVATPDGPQPLAAPVAAPVADSVVAGPPVVFEPPSPMPLDDLTDAGDDSTDLPDGAIVIEAAPRHVANPMVDAPVDEPEPWDAVGGIEIDVVSRNTDAAPPLEFDDEGFDPDALVIDPPR